MLSRICNLLHYDIKPVFVFDGPPPALKLQTLVHTISQHALRLNSSGNAQEGA